MSIAWSVQPYREVRACDVAVDHDAAVAAYAAVCLAVPAFIQGLTLVYLSAQPEPFLKQKHTLHTPAYPLLPINSLKQPLNAPPFPQKALTLS